MSSARRFGFTFIEIAITVAVIVIVSVVVYANYNDINNAGEIMAASDKVRENIRLAQNFAMTGRMFKYKTPIGWGVAFDRTTSKYTMFGDLNGNKLYDNPVKVLIHGTEWSSGGTFNESSTSSRQVTRGDGSNAATFPSFNNGAGQPTGNGYWEFNGNQYLKVGASDDFNFAAKDFTFDLWFKPSGLGALRYLLVQPQSFALLLDGSNKLLFRFTDSLGATTEVSSSQAVADTNWHHGAVSRVGSRLYLFLDGQTAAVDDIGTSTAMRNMNAQIVVGDFDGTTANKWTGAIDEVRVVNGWGHWFEKFTVPTAYHEADEERYREAKLPPGLVFERLHLGTTTTNNLSVYFSPSNYLMYGNANSGDQDVRVIINRRGAEDTGLAGDAPREFIILPSGLVSSTRAN